ncbi:hypothetical protein EI200_15520 [Peribacillus simplex]|uniref:hypothetical protein n=1 Tax=Peribacillus simplex TaxID=1478 RepID=UPI000F63658E|nr:hypothetical protein [Peribacillus simplex]RRN69900.1 hypothetical protein EI200_15520 [Peribacillus simplex]
MIKTKLIGTEGTRLLREYASKGDPAGAKAPRADRRGKRVLGGEINGHFLKPQKNCRQTRFSSSLPAV